MGKHTGRIKRGKYIYIKKWDHPNCGKQGYVAEHRLVMENHIGRYLTSNEVVHHKNHDESDNRIENLELCESAGKHMQKYHPEALIKASKNCIGREPWNKGKKNVYSEETKKAMGKGKEHLKGVPLTEEHKKKISEGNKGKMKGVRRAPQTEFKKGMTPWNKGLTLK